MQVKKAELVSLFQELGFKTAESWPDQRFQDKLQKLPKMMEDEDSQPSDPDALKLAKKLVKALNAEDEIEIVGSNGKAKAEAEEAPAKKGSAKKAAKAEEPEEEEGEESETETNEDGDEVVPVKEKKKGPPKKAGGPKGPGVIGTIVSMLTKATEKKPVTKENILDKLVETFPDRDRESMARTINVQIPNRIQNEKKLTVHKNEKKPAGYWATGGDSE